MTSAEKTKWQPPVVLIGVATALLIAGAAILLVPNEVCPECHGFTIAHTERTVRGLPDPSGATPCNRCVGRGKVSRFSIWVHQDVEGD